MDATQPRSIDPLLRLQALLNKPAPAPVRFDDFTPAVAAPAVAFPDFAPAVKYPALAEVDVESPQPKAEPAQGNVVENAPRSLAWKTRTIESAPQAQAADTDAPRTFAVEVSADKNDLARSLMDLMAGNGQPHEKALATDTLLRLLPQLSHGTRAALATRVALMDHPPGLLVDRLLADSNVAVSGPLLEDCGSVSDDALLAIVDGGNRDRMRLVARRRYVSRKVAEALAKRGDMSTRLTLLRNAGAELSPSCFAELLSHAVNNEPDLLAPLCTRRELPVHIALEAFWPAPAQLRRFIVSRFLTDSQGLAKILKLGAAAEDSAAPQAALVQVGEAVEAALRGEREFAAAQLAGAAGIVPETAHRILNDAQGEPLMALLKTCGVPRSEMEDNIALLAHGENPLISPLRNLGEVQAFFDGLSFTKARVLLKYWDWACTKSGPYAPEMLS